MLIFAIDDEPKMLRLLHSAIAKAAPEAELRDFSLAAAALEAVRREGLRPDAVFSDIQMPGMNGLELAVRLKDLAPETKLIFVTGYSEYAVEAYRLHASGYVMKPVDPERIREELGNLFSPPEPEPGKLRVQCFGYFEVFWNGTPLEFKRRKTKELFALLVDRQGGFCTAEELVTAMWEDEENLTNLKHNLRNLVSDLQKTLREIGMEEVLIRRSSQMAVRPELLDCDYYRMLNGDMRAVNAYRGEYMSQYSWAELTRGSLYFRENNLTGGN